MQYALPFNEPFHPSTFVADAPQQPAPWTGEREEKQFVAMLSAFRLGGGVVSGDDLSALVRSHHDQPVSIVARWLVNRSILCFDWHGQTLIPLFQFDRSTMQPLPVVLAVLRELNGTFNDWEMSLWFAQPNSWLANEPPVLALRSDPLAVLQAAQADRFIALG
jgi:hypothetical protein